MTTWRCQVVSIPKTGDVAKDWVANVLYYDSNTTGAGPIGDALVAAFTSGAGGFYSQFANVQCRVYDHNAPLHSPPVYIASHSGSGTNTYGPRQVALCLSFYSGLNIKGQRGRIYIGPWPYSSLHERPDSTTLTAMMGLAAAIKNPGGADVIHKLFHPASRPPYPPRAAFFSNVSNYWANDKWDTIRSRLPKETARQTLP